MLVIFVVLTLVISSSIIGSSTQNSRKKIIGEHKNYTNELKEIEDSVINRKNGVELNQARRFYEIDQ
tara:strand:+ start:244 stop:444 length:201 start_codon:yes stop_codon:yes gene_type:complete